MEPAVAIVQSAILARPADQVLRHHRRAAVAAPGDADASYETNDIAGPTPTVARLGRGLQILILLIGEQRRIVALQQVVLPVDADPLRAPQRRQLH
ncbi:hypothetical protein D3C84_1036210 [compost metagenome]